MITARPIIILTVYLGFSLGAGAGVRVSSPFPQYSKTPPFTTPSQVKSPFWLKAKYQKKLDEGEAVIRVGVDEPSKIETNKEVIKKLRLDGVKRVKSYTDKAFQRSVGLPFLTDMTSFIVESKWKPGKNRLFLHGLAYKYHGRMWLEFYYTTGPSSQGKSYYQIHWRHYKGLFKGMTGVLRFEDVGRRQTEITMTARYNFEKLPIPKFFIEFGMEVVLEKMATRMGNYLENYNKSPKHKGVAK